MFADCVAAAIPQFVTFESVWLAEALTAGFSESAKGFWVDCPEVVDGETKFTTPLPVLDESGVLGDGCCSFEGLEGPRDLVVLTTAGVDVVLEGGGRGEGVEVELVLVRSDAKMGIYLRYLTVSYWSTNGHTDARARVCLTGSPCVWNVSSVR